MKTKSAFLHCRFDPRLKELATKAAAREEVSLSSLVEAAIKFYLRERYGKKG
jgi:predicted HicB family RNase H-like nuclease